MEGGEGRKGVVIPCSPWWWIAEEVWGLAIMTGWVQLKVKDGRLHWERGEV